MLLRAEEAAKCAGKYALWFSARDEPYHPAQVAKDPHKMEKRLEAFLQLHEQKTAGIPGLNILYEGMRARVTEKIVKGRHIKILKHTPCTVIGWDLHAIDRKSIFGYRRMLDMAPRCIFLQFDNVKWLSLIHI